MSNSDPMTIRAVDDIAEHDAEEEGEHRNGEEAWVGLLVPRDAIAIDDALEPSSELIDTDQSRGLRAAAMDAVVHLELNRVDEDDGIRFGLLLGHIAECPDVWCFPIDALEGRSGAPGVARDEFGLLIRDELPIDGFLAALELVERVEDHFFLEDEGSHLLHVLVELAQHHNLAIDRAVDGALELLNLADGDFRLGAAATFLRHHNVVVDHVGVVSLAQLEDLLPGALTMEEHDEGALRDLIAVIVEEERRVTNRGVLGDGVAAQRDVERD